MHKRDYSLYVKDVLGSIGKIEEFVGDMSYDGFIKDDKTSSAVMHKLEIIGEASKKRSKRYKCQIQAHPLE